MFQKTKKIQPEGLSNYKVRSPIPIEPNEAPSCSNFVDPMEEDETNIEHEENKEKEGNMLEDNIRDRDITDTLVGKKLKVSKYVSNNFISEKSLQQINFFQQHKCKYKFYKKVEITKTNIIYKSKKINIYCNRVMNKFQH